MKFSLDKKVEFEKHFELFWQISVKVVTKVAENFDHFTWYGKK